MAAVLKMFNSSVHEAFLGNVTWSGVEVMMCLMTAYTYDETDATYTQVVIDHTEHATANGYTVGGVVAANPTHGIAAGIVLFGTDSVVWTATGALIVFTYQGTSTTSGRFGLFIIWLLLNHRLLQRLTRRWVRRHKLWSLRSLPRIPMA